LHRSLRRGRRIADSKPGSRRRRMTRGRQAACGFMDNASALPTTPQAHQQQAESKTCIDFSSSGRAPAAKTGSPDAPPERPPVRRRCRGNGPTTSGQLECYINRTS
jgi:hypothetical protein